MKKLKVGILINSDQEIAAWELETVKQLQKADFVCDIVFIFFRQFKSSKNNWAYHLFKEFENRWFTSKYVASKIFPIPAGYKCLKLKTIIEGKSLIAGKEDIDLLKQESLDIIYYSKNNSTEENFYSLAKFGLWNITFGYKQYQNSKPTGFWEVMNDEPVTGSSLQVNYNARRITVYDCTTKTVPYSVLNNFNSIAWRSSSFLYFRLRELYLLGDEIFFSKYPLAGMATSKPLELPSAGKLIFLFIRNIYKYLLYKWNKKKKNKTFTLLYKNGSFNPEKPEFKNFKSLATPADTFWADPFVIQENGKSLIFFEEFQTKNDKAHISLIEIDKTGKLSNPQIVLKRNYHLSYPFVFKFNDQYYMLPETSANKTVELHKATSFPNKWEIAHTLINDIILIDPTLFFKDEIWWLFGTTQTHPFTSTNDQLMLYYSNDLLSSDWKSHPQNPVATHLSNCRPAGKIFEKDGKYYRPAQNNASKQYGYAISINEIKTLNEHTYKEEKILEINPSKENVLLDMNTLNF
ncbi:MAG: hypothetical protein M3352_09225 [Bacteroidota bacterium]|nr:hypothetical protein [Bacteroidota bacterium]